MISFKILEIKKFMSALLLKDIFDSFLLSEMELKMNYILTIDGRRYSDWYTEEELRQMEEPSMLWWKEIKPTVLEQIKGKKTPLEMKIVLKFSRYQTELFIQDVDTLYDPNEVEGLYINIRFHRESLHIISAVSVKTFHPDKELERAWDKRILLFLKVNKIQYEEE